MNIVTKKRFLEIHSLIIWVGKVFVENNISPYKYYIYK